MFHILHLILNGYVFSEGLYTPINTNATTLLLYKKQSISPVVKKEGILLGSWAVTNSNFNCQLVRFIS